MVSTMAAAAAAAGRTNMAHTDADDAHRPICVVGLALEGNEAAC